MPDWLMALGAGLLGFAALVTAAGVVRNKIVRPLFAGWSKAVDLMERLLDAAHLVQGAAREMREFAGAFTIFAVGIKEQVDQVTLRVDRLEEMQELVIDMQADLERHTRDAGGHG